MSGCYSNVQVIGRLGQDVELRHTGRGTAVTDLSIATERRYKQGDEWKSKTVWIKAVLFGRRAEVAKEYLGKGSRVFIAGELDVNEWEDRNGQKRYDLRIMASDMVFLGSKEGGGRESSSGGSGGGGGQGGIDDSEIPFSPFIP